MIFTSKTIPILVIDLINPNKTPKPKRKPAPTLTEKRGGGE